MRVDLDVLRRATPEQTATFFAGVDPEELVAAVRRTDDAALLRLIGREEIRSTAVAGVLDRLHEYAVTDRLAELDGAVRLDLQRRTETLERHLLVIERGTLKHVAHVPADEPADVVLRTSILRFVRLVSGERNAALEYLAGNLDIEGDATLALAVGGIFEVPGTTGVAVDPTALDPVDVARALADVDPAHLRTVMASGFRPIVLDEIFRRLPEFVDARKAARADLTVGFRLLGRADGGLDRWTVRLRGGTATVTALGEESGGSDDVHGERRDATITCEAADFLRLATGHLSAVTGVLRGQLKVRGDKAKALQLNAALAIPSVKGARGARG